MTQAQSPHYAGAVNSTKPSTETLKQAWEIASYISSHYSDAEKIVELGVGFAPWIALELRRLLPHSRIIVVDKNPEALRSLGGKGLELVLDDFLTPALKHYIGASLLYSIHPPPELLPHMLVLAERVRAAFLVKPLSEDAYFYGFHPPWRRISLESTVIFLREG